MLIPNVNGLIHFYAFAFSFIYSWLCTKLSKINKGDGPHG